MILIFGTPRLDPDSLTLGGHSEPLYIGHNLSCGKHALAKYDVHIHILGVFERIIAFIYILIFELKTSSDALRDFW